MTESMAEAGTNVFVIGGGEGSSMVTSEYVNQTMLDQVFLVGIWMLAVKM